MDVLWCIKITCALAHMGSKFDTVNFSVNIVSYPLPKYYRFILQTARIYSKATGKIALLAVCSRDSMQVLPVCSIYSKMAVYETVILMHCPNFRRRILCCHFVKIFA